MSIKPKKNKRKKGPDAKYKEKIKRTEEQDQVKKPEFEYEDVFEDEFEEEIEATPESNALQDTEENKIPPLRQYTAMFRDGIDRLGENEKMEYNSSAYKLLHQLTLPQSCLTFEFLNDDLGARRTKFPMQLSMVAGSQAPSDTPGENRIYLFHASALHKTRTEDESDASNSDDDDIDEDAKVITSSVKHWGSINRIKAMPQQNGVIASWSESGKVFVHDLTANLKALHQDSFETLNGLSSNSSLRPSEQTMPIYTFKKHSQEGYALAFSKVNKGFFASGSCDSTIYTHTISDDGRVVSSGNSFSSHSDSVEDIVFSPAESTVFCSASVDKTIKVYDTRSPKLSHMLSFEAHDSDVNVLSWNEMVNYLLASGSDKGDFKVWDLRMIGHGGNKTESIGYFDYHKSPISSIKWDFYDDSVLSVACDDNSVSVWDLSLEEEDPTMSGLSNEMNALKIRDRDGKEISLPPQLLFLHQGMQYPKDISFHSQIPGLIGATTLDSIHLFICEPLDPRKNLKAST